MQSTARLRSRRDKGARRGSAGGVCWRGRACRPPAVDELVACLSDARRVIFADAGHDLLRLRTKAFAPVFAGRGRDGLAGAEQAAAASVRLRPRWEPWAARLAAGLP